MLSISRAPGAAATKYWKVLLDISTRAETLPPSAFSQSATPGAFSEVANAP